MTLPTPPNLVGLGPARHLTEYLKRQAYAGVVGSTSRQPADVKPEYVHGSVSSFWSWQARSICQKGLLDTRPWSPMPSPIHGASLAARCSLAARRQPVPCSYNCPTMAPAATVVVVRNGGIGKARRGVTQTSAEACRYTSHAASLAIVLGFGIDAQAGMPRCTSSRQDVGPRAAAEMMMDQPMSNRLHLERKWATGISGAISASCSSSQPA